MSGSALGIGTPSHFSEELAGSEVAFVSDWWESQVRREHKCLAMARLCQSSGEQACSVEIICMHSTCDSEHEKLSLAVRSGNRQPARSLAWLAWQLVSPLVFVQGLRQELVVRLQRE